MPLTLLTHSPHPPTHLLSQPDPSSTSSLSAIPSGNNTLTPAIGRNGEGLRTRKGTGGGRIIERIMETLDDKLVVSRVTDTRESSGRTRRGAVRRGCHTSKLSAIYFSNPSTNLSYIYSYFPHTHVRLIPRCCVVRGLYTYPPLQPIIIPSCKSSSHVSSLTYAHTHTYLYNYVRKMNFQHGRHVLLSRPFFRCIIPIEYKLCIKITKHFIDAFGLTL